ncbi:hypothetical protein [Natranaerofaba carboxydovora]|uniref:hypothetical protein n=1 Tax=Natranaerofaba carboxydovora TaxID=2742683 RepID=UPI001F139F0E|nr:hypothetical protein [Natranaerofaba carboxydovora]UMZ72523.1 hypothetical protein ACONDI_00043 [Natranaerofaba carboxydovora]
MDLNSPFVVTREVFVEKAVEILTSNKPGIFQVVLDKTVIYENGIFPVRYWVDESLKLRIPSPKKNHIFVLGYKDEGNKKIYTEDEADKYVGEKVKDMRDQGMMEELIEGTVNYLVDVFIPMERINWEVMLNDYLLIHGKITKKIEYKHRYGFLVKRLIQDISKATKDKANNMEGYRFYNRHYYNDTKVR